MRRRIMTLAAALTAGGALAAGAPAGAVAAYDANGSGDFDSAEEVEAAIAGGAATDLGVIKRFVCPVIKIPRD